MILLSHNFWLHSKVKILFTSFDLYFKSFSFVDMLVDLFWGFCGLTIHLCDNIAWSQTTPERKKAYSWTSPQKPLWGQNKVAVVERWTVHCWEIHAIGGGSTVFTKRCRAQLSLSPVIRWSFFPPSLGLKNWDQLSLRDACLIHLI